MIKKEEALTRLDIMAPDKRHVFSKVDQKFAPNEPFFNMLDETTICKDCNLDDWKVRWERFVAHESSGPCYTYNPPRKSVAGSHYNLKIVFPNFGELILIS